MRILLKFAKEFEHDDFEQDIEANETVENLKYNTYDVYYKNNKLTNNKQRIAEIFSVGDPVHEVKVVKKGSSVLMMDQANAFKESLTNNFNVEELKNGTSKLAPILVAIILIIIFFGILG